MNASANFENIFARILRSGLIQKTATIFQGLFKDFSRRNIISQIVQKCTFPVYSNKALRLELFA